MLVPIEDILTLDEIEKLEDLEDIIELPALEKGEVFKDLLGESFISHEIRGVKGNTRGRRKRGHGFAASSFGLSYS
jgi:hypothetical protein